ncbi:hypothetical protein PC129_g23731 [Phytophthora cactorum]|uniref:Uncharacterized protein n=1 Tax=Phytophthora cactorum TaxID=29920 RepID=A0A8T1ALF7_9STRA|nr:hypothetical protein Pcac1_g16832 [Phytophthora cactorum]KAG2782141.1 hypothetical protein Pcac1_g8112 [Phytophthora cactorum]KAG2791414.1 hypothetical protein PC111_g23938 [Phytophthora cactorum]KAG2823393.1 hypothetical protein PC113_g22186 [Phytophthora cactorum]KAG2871522.1 hypothetical protein PC114_g26872 [Phytophthora cactorum]
MRPSNEGYKPTLRTKTDGSCSRSIGIDAISSVDAYGSQTMRATRTPSSSSSLTVPATPLLS